MCEQGLATEIAGSYTLTTAGMRQIRCLHQLQNPRSLQEPRKVHVRELALFELLCCLIREGWSWQKLRPPRLPLPHIIGESQMLFFSSGLQLMDACLRCLLDRQRLKQEFDISSIPHTLSAEAYGAIFNGTQPADAQARFPKEARKKRPFPLLADADVVFGEEDDLPSPQDCDEEMSVGSQSAEAPSMLDAPEDAAVQEQEHREEPFCADSIQAMLQRSMLVKFGGFSFSGKTPASAPPHGGIEARCRWHKKSKKTDCKKYLPFRSACSVDQQTQVLLLLHWCNHARDFQLQREHMRMPLSLVPPVILCMPKC